MRLFLNNLIFFILVCLPLQGEEVKKTYIVKVGGIKIGELVWEMKTTTNYFSNKLKLRSKGLLSGVGKVELCEEIEFRRESAIFSENEVCNVETVTRR